MSDSDLIEYYSRRATEYEQIYLKPERQGDLAALTRLLLTTLAGHDVLEIACGTGWWTERLAPFTRTIVATDASPEVLEIARRKSYPPGSTPGPGPGVPPAALDPASAPGHRPPAVDDGPPAEAPQSSPLPSRSRVRIAHADAFALEAVEGRFSAAFVGFLWSHIRSREIPRLLQGLHARLGPGARIVFTDNRYVAESSTPVSRRDADGDTYQIRRLADGSEHEVLKNFPTADELRAAVAAIAERIEVTELTYYWCLSYIVKP